MSKKDKQQPQPQCEEAQADETAEATAPEAAQSAKEAAPSELERKSAELAKEHEQYLRLAAEYDNFRKRSAREKDAIFHDAQADTIGKFLPVFDNLDRAAQQPTEDEAYKKGVQMTLDGLREVMQKLGVEEYGEVGDSFDPQRHNAVMHIEQEDLGESVLAQVFQKGFAVGDRVIRCAMVQVAN